MKRFYLAMVALLVLACGETEPESMAQATNPKFQVERLFAVDGCVVYRFEDQGRNHYFSNCHGAISHEVSCGKNCNYEESTKTAEAQP